MPDIMSISEIVERAKQDLLPVSEYALRRWVRTGAIPARRVGKKYLVSYSRLVRFLSCEDGQDNTPVAPVAAGGIRRIDV